MKLPSFGALNMKAEESTRRMYIGGKKVTNIATTQKKKRKRIIIIDGIKHVEGC